MLRNVSNENSSQNLLEKLKKKKEGDLILARLQAVNPSILTTSTRMEQMNPIFMHRETPQLTQPVSKFSIQQIQNQLSHEKKDEKTLREKKRMSNFSLNILFRNYL